MNELQQGNQLFVRDFELDPASYPVPSDLTEWRARIREVIAELLDKDMERLLLVLYRIDVPEHKVKAILGGAPVGTMADLLAELILERELQKVETRRKYRAQ